MLYEIFYYMVFTCHSAVKIWSSISIQDIVLDQINPIQLIWFVFCVRFAWQVTLMKMIIYMFTTQRRIKNLVKHLRWSFLQVFITWKLFIIFTQSSIWNNWLGSKYASEISKVTSHKCEGKVNTYAKQKSKYCKKGVVSCKSIRKLVWPNSHKNYSELFQKKAALKFLGKHAWQRPRLSRCTTCSLERYWSQTIS